MCTLLYSDLLFWRLKILMISCPQNKVSSMGRERKKSKHPTNDPIARNYSMFAIKIHVRLVNIIISHRWKFDLLGWVWVFSGVVMWIGLSVLWWLSSFRNLKLSWGNAIQTSGVQKKLSCSTVTLLQINPQQDEGEKAKAINYISCDGPRKSINTDFSVVCEKSLIPS